MDEAVLRAMARWPDVPAVYGWLRLDARGRWHVWNGREPGVAPGCYELIEQPSIVAFIGRNYARDPHGRWFFQNGPQRVFVSLERAPIVYRLDDAARGLVTHWGAPAGAIKAIRVDDAGGVLIEAAAGPGGLLDRDVLAWLARLEAVVGRELDLAALAAQGATLDLDGRAVLLGTIDTRELGERLGFVAEPGP